MSVPGILRSVGYRQTGGGAYTTKNAVLVGAPDFGDDTLTVATGEGIDKRVGFAQSFDVSFHEWSAFTDLNTIMQAGNTIDLQFIFEAAASNAFTYTPVYFTVAPLVGQLPDKVKVWIDAAGVADNPTTDGDASWVDLGPIRSGSSPTFEANADSNGLDNPLYTVTTMEWQMEFINDVAATLQSFASTKCKIAIQHTDGTYFMVDQCNSHSLVQPNIGLDAHVSRLATFTAVKRNILDIITLPASPPNYFYGAQVSGRASATTESSILTISTV